MGQLHAGVPCPLYCNSLKDFPSRPPHPAQQNQLGWLLPYWLQDDALARAVCKGWMHPGKGMAPRVDAPSESEARSVIRRASVESGGEFGVCVDSLDGCFGTDAPDRRFRTPGKNSGQQDTPVARNGAALLPYKGTLLFWDLH